MKHYEKQGQRFIEPLMTATGRQIFNPTAEQMQAEGQDMQSALEILEVKPDEEVE